MKKQIAIALSAAALLASSASFAHAGPYVSGQLGMGGVDTPDHKLSAASPASTDVAKKERNEGLSNGRVAVGYMFDKGTNPVQFGVEAGYTMFKDNTYKLATGASSNVTNTKLSYDRHDFDVLGVARYNVADNVDLFAKAGLTYATQEMKVTDKNSLLANGKEKVSDTHHGFQPEVVLGVGYDLSECLNLNVAYTHVFGDKIKFSKVKSENTVDSLNKLASVNTVSLGLTYSF